MLAETETLRSWLDRMQYPVPENLGIEWGRQLANELAALHRFGLAHQDVRLTNIFVGADASVHVGPSTPDTQFTQSVLIALSGLLSDHPARGRTRETARGHAEVEDDIRAWGGVMYELLTHHGPFEAVTGSRPATDVDLRTNPMPLCWYRADVSPALETLIMAALDGGKARRPRSGTQLLLELALLDRRVV